ncbi:MAG: hypothetical protein GY754_02585 [bacterium]|nr:hypothetical protein [bacterium]
MELSDIQALFDHMPELAVVYSVSANKIKYINHSGLVMLEAESLSQLNEISPEKLVDPENKDFLVEKMERALERKESTSLMKGVLVGLNNHHLFVEASLNAIHLENEPAVIIFARNVTRFKQNREKVLKYIMRLLSNKEKEYLMLLADGLNRKEISHRMEIQVETCDTYRKRIKSKLKNHEEMGELIESILNLFDWDER